MLKRIESIKKGISSVQIDNSKKLGASCNEDCADCGCAKCDGKCDGGHRGHLCSTCRSSKCFCETVKNTCNRNLWSLGTWQDGHGRQVENLSAGSAVQTNVMVQAANQSLRT